MSRFEILYNKYRSVVGFNKRQRYLIMSYTAANWKSSIATLTGPSVSVHYLIPDETDATYLNAGFDQLKIFNLVDENDRAWHAGVSYWQGRNNLNDSSIGIELVNQATDDHGKFTFPPYTDEQTAAVIQLAQNIVSRYPNIVPRNVIGHSDVAIGRKSDPGPMFPWKQLYDAGVGAWYDENTKHKYEVEFSNKARDSFPTKSQILKKLSDYGYDVSKASTDNGYAALIRAFQLHFRPSDYSGKPDLETVAILWALAEKYGTD